jgi:glutamate synthase (NADPH/NADH) small chain
LEEFDAVYLGVGPQADEALAGGVDPVTFATAERSVFAGGGLRGGGAYSPVGSMSDGLRAAVSIDRFLKGESLVAQRDNEGPFATPLFTSLTGVEPSAALSPSGPGPGYSREEAVAEAKRCLLCECMECVKACVYLEHFKEYPGKGIRRVVKNISSLPGKSYRTHTKFINACSLCGLCGTVCPTDLDMAAVNSPARQVMWEKGYMPPAIHEFAVRDMESSNTGTAALVRNQPGHDTSAHVFFPGCQLTASAPAHMERMYAHLMSRLEGGVGLMLGCCGAPAAWAGRQDLFGEVIDAFTRDWEEMGRPRVILACPTCSLLFKERLAGVPQISLWEVLDAEGLPEHSHQGHGETLALHDSCTARMAPEIQDSVRRIAERLGYRVEELPYNRQLTKCCGYGGLVYQSNREVTDKITRSRIEESAADYLTYCTNCRDFFAEKGKASYHLLDLVFDGYAAGADVRPGPTLSERRANRRESAGRLLTELWGEPMPEPEDDIALRVRMAPEVAVKMERDFILLDDVKAVIHWAETTGNKVETPATGRIVAHLRPHIVTYWVEYAKDGGEYEVFNAYSHRMQIVEDVTP